MISPPQMAAGLIALIAAGVGTWLTSGHKPAPAVSVALSPVATSFAALEKADKLSTIVYETVTPHTVKSIPIPKQGASAGEVLYLSGEQPDTAIKAKLSEREEITVQAQSVCERYGGSKVVFNRRHHEQWRCVYPHGHRHHRRKND